MLIDLFRSLISNGYVRAQILGVVRDLAKAAGGLLVADGLLGSSQQEQLIGAAGIIVGMGFSAYDKYAVKQKIAAAIAAPRTTAATAIDALISK